MSSGERLIADSRAFAAGMKEERQQILGILKIRLNGFSRFGPRRSSGQLVEVRNLIKLLEERNRMGS